MARDSLNAHQIPYAFSTTALVLRTSHGVN